MFKSYIAGQGLAYLLPDHTSLFKNAGFELNPGEKAALTGDNGTGKSTLFKIIAGELEPSAGILSGKENAVLLPQNIHDIRGSVLTILGIAEKLEALNRIADGSAMPEDWDVIGEDWDLKEKLRQEITDWHLGHISLDSDFSELSGGEKEKILLIRTFLSPKPILLLDEPTNNLDTEGKAVLLYKIKASTKGILIISHDRTLLNEMDCIWELSPDGIERFGGNYDFYKTEKIRQRAAKENQLVSLQREKRQLQQKREEVMVKAAKQNKYGDKQVENHRYSRLVARLKKDQAEGSRAKKLSILNEKEETKQAEIQALSLSLREEAIKIPLPAKPFIRERLLVIEEINFSYGEKRIIRNLSFIMRGDERIAIRGENGCGKTTLLKLIQGQAAPESGGIKLNGKAVYLDQNMNLLDNFLPLYEGIAKFCPQAKENEIRKTLANFKFRNIAGEKLFGILSGGERLKACLAAIFCTPEQPDIIILDEPTNNLDIRSMEILENALAQYQGALLAVSHDTAFLQNIKISRFIEL